jgi:hypothetical protein
MSDLKSLSKNTYSHQRMWAVLPLLPTGEKYTSSRTSYTSRHQEVFRTTKTRRLIRNIWHMRGGGVEIIPSCCRCGMDDMLDKPSCRRLFLQFHRRLNTLGTTVYCNSKASRSESREMAQAKRQNISGISCPAELSRAT